MRKSGHANGYARTLITGVWPSFDVLPPAEAAATGVKLKPVNMRLSRAAAGDRARSAA
jgi:hypothetical protein